MMNLVWDLAIEIERGVNLLRIMIQDHYAIEEVTSYLLILFKYNEFLIICLDY